MSTENVTPLMKQYFKIKQQHADVLLFFQVGDFYELFFDDAKIAAAFLGITLTKRGKNNGEPIPLCGVPVHAMDHYCAKLVRGGFKVAICDQLEQAVPGKVVDRGVTQVLTPGTLTDSKLLDEKSASYLFSFFPMHDQWGLIFGELLTAQLFATVLKPQSERLIESELIRFFPDEILVPNNTVGKHFQTYFKQLGYCATCADIGEHDSHASHAWAEQQFSTDVFAQLSKNSAVDAALSNFYAYLRKNQERSLAHFRTIQFYEPDDFLILDAASQKNLELVRCADGSSKNSLFALLDKSKTPMGSRTIKKWVMRPLVEHDAIVQRYDAVGFLHQNFALISKSSELLSEISDLERIVGRIMLKRATLNDFLALRQALSKLPTLCDLFYAVDLPYLLTLIFMNISDFNELVILLTNSLNDDLQKEQIIKASFDNEVDRLRELIENANQKIIELEQREQQETGISSLKIRYTGAFGYYIEITKTHYDKIPAHYVRQQTLVGRERFMTPALLQLQSEIVDARTRIQLVEQAVFEEVQKKVMVHGAALRKCAQALAHLDALCAFARLAYDNNYVRPTFNAQRNIEITAGRHPVVEQSLNGQFIANNTALTDAQSLWVITGPNMGGKSTYLRQVALISIMAQCGAFVPAQQANLSILDRIFTRIGAGDNVAEGKSTFLVEMEETAIICTQATERSLVILDEVGRGTSTFDGIAIAQAVIEYVYTHVKARCLFATHYHELTELAKTMPGIACYHAASMRTKDGIVFLHKMVPGTADGSFGIEVAKLAELPAQIIERAEELQKQLSMAPAEQKLAKSAEMFLNSESNFIEQNVRTELAYLRQQIAQQEKKLSQLQNIDWENLSPKKAFDVLWEFKE